MDQKEIKYNIEQELNLEIRAWLHSEFNRLAKSISRLESLSWRQFTNPSNNRFYVELKSDCMKFNARTLDEWYNEELKNKPGNDPYVKGSKFSDFVKFSEQIIPVFGNFDGTIFKDLFGTNCWVTVDKDGFRSQGHIA